MGSAEEVLVLAAMEMGGEVTAVVVAPAPAPTPTAERGGASCW